MLGNLQKLGLTFSVGFMNNNQYPVEVRDLSDEWLSALSNNTPAGDEILEVLQGVTIALGFGDPRILQAAPELLERLRGNASDEYTLGAIAMLMNVCQLQRWSPQESFQFLETQLTRWRGAS